MAKGKKGPALFEVIRAAQQRQAENEQRQRQQLAAPTPTALSGATRFLKSSGSWLRSLNTPSADSTVVQSAATDATERQTGHAASTKSTSAAEGNIRPAAGLKKIVHKSLPPDAISTASSTAKAPVHRPPEKVVSRVSVSEREVWHDPTAPETGSTERAAITTVVSNRTTNGRTNEGRRRDGDFSNGETDNGQSGNGDFIDHQYDAGRFNGGLSDGGPAADARSAGRTLSDPQSGNGRVTHHVSDDQSAFDERTTDGTSTETPGVTELDQSSLEHLTRPAPLEAAQQSEALEADDDDAHAGVWFDGDGSTEIDDMTEGVEVEVAPPSAMTSDEEVVLEAYVVDSTAGEENASETSGDGEPSVTTTEAGGAFTHTSTTALNGSDGDVGDESVDDSASPQTAYVPQSASQSAGPAASEAARRVREEIAASAERDTVVDAHEPNRRVNLKGTSDDVQPSQVERSADFDESSVEASSNGTNHADGGAAQIDRYMSRVGKRVEENRRTRSEEQSVVAEGSTDQIVSPDASTDHLPPAGQGYTPRDSDPVFDSVHELFAVTLPGASAADGRRRWPSIPFAINYYAAGLVAGVLLVGLALTVLIGRSRQAPVEQALRPDVLEVGSGGAKNTQIDRSTVASGSTIDDSVRARNRGPETNVGLQQTTDATGKTSEIIPGKRVPGQQYLVLLSFPARSGGAKNAAELVKFLTGRGVPVTAEHPLPDFSSNYYSVVTLKGFEKTQNNPQYDEYVAQLNKLMREYARGSEFKSIAPAVYRWR